MKELYANLFQIAKAKGYHTPAHAMRHLCKLTEEIGEVAAEANKLTGVKVKKKKKTDEEILADLTEEIGDALQNLLLIGAVNGVPYEKIEAALQHANEKWGNQPKPSE